MRGGGRRKSRINRRDRIKAKARKLTGIHRHVEEFGYQHLGGAGIAALLEGFDQEEGAPIGVGQPLHVDQDFVAQIVEVQLIGNVLNQG